MQPLDKPRHSTSAVVMNNVAIYIMPGATSVHAQSNTQLFMLDLRPASKFNKDDLAYVRAIASQKWSSLVVTDAMFN